MSEKYVLYLLKNVCKTTVIFAIDVFRSGCKKCGRSSRHFECLGGGGGGGGKAGAVRNILVITGSLVIVTPGAAALLLQCHGKLEISKPPLSNKLNRFK